MYSGEAPLIKHENREESANIKPFDQTMTIKAGDPMR